MPGFFIKIGTMFKRNCGFLVVTILFSIQFLNAQEFPSTKKQVNDWLTASSWNLKWLVTDNRKMDAALINMKASISFLTDSTYQMNFMSENRRGKFEIDIQEKYIKLLNDNSPGEMFIISVSETEIWAQSKNNEDDEPIMIFFKGKK